MPTAPVLPLSPSATPAPTTVPLPPGTVLPPGWDPAAEGAKWRKLAKELAQKRRERPAPRVNESFASDLSGQQRRPGRKRASEFVAPDVDGCNRAYGTAGQCIPTQLPPGVAGLCEYLADRGFPPVRVNGADPLGVDPNGDRIACN